MDVKEEKKKIVKPKWVSRRRVVGRWLTRPRQPPPPIKTETRGSSAALPPVAAATASPYTSPYGDTKVKRESKRDVKKNILLKPLPAPQKKRLAAEWFSRYFEAGQSHPSAYAGASNFLAERRRRGDDPRVAEAKSKWLRSQPTHQIFAPARRHYARRPFVVHSLDEQWQMDLSDMQWYPDENDGAKWILFVVDVLSRYAWVVPQESKSGEKTSAAMALVFDRVQAGQDGDHTLPRVIYVDKGTEFYNRDVKALLARYPIPPLLASGESVTKAALVERLQRTIKNRLWKYFRENGTHRWVDVIQSLVEGYNHSPHSAHGRPPASVRLVDEPQVWERLYGRWQRERELTAKDPTVFKFQVGDVVRLSKQAARFDKAYLPQWTEEWFKVRARDRGPPPYYRLEDYDGKDVVKGTFYEEEMQRVEEEEIKNARHHVEYVIDRRTHPESKREQVLVKWKGWPDKYNQWIDASGLEDVHQQPPATGKKKKKKKKT